MEALFIYLLKSAGILTIFFLAYKVLLQKETFFSLNRHYLLGGIIASLLLPLVVFESYIYVDPVVLPEAIFYDTPSTIVESANSAQSTPFDWSALLFNIYLLGVILTSIQFLIQLFSLYRIARSGTIKRFKSFKLIEVSSIVSPFSFFNYIIYNPENFSERDLQIILNHEKAHGKQLHSIDILVSQTFLILQWFNPIAWFYKKTIQQNLEFMADKEAISNIESKKNYQHTLLKVSVASYCASITNNFYNSLIKKRIIMLNQQTSKTKNLWKYGLILPALALFLVSFNTKTVEIIKERGQIMEEPFEDLGPKPMELIIPPSETKDPSMITSKNDDDINTETAQDIDIIAKINKDTTKEELDQIKKDLREKGMEFNYNKLDYNSEREITSIRIKYSDKGTGNSGTYHINSDDNEPIKPIFIYTNENGGFGIGNSPDGRDHKEQMLEHEERLKEHKERAEEHKERMYEHKERMKEHNEEVREEHEERMEEHKEHMEERKAKMTEEHEVRIKEMKERHVKMQVEQEVRIKEQKVRVKERTATMHKEHEVRIKEQKVRLKEQKERMKEQKVRMKEVREERKMRMKDGDSNRFVYRVKTNGNKGNNVFVYETGSSEDVIDVNVSRDNNTLYIVDGKKAKEGYVRTMDPNNIASVNVIKGESAIIAYGKSGKNGVIQVTTKSNGNAWKSSNIVSEVQVIGSDGTNISVMRLNENMYQIDKNTSNQELNELKEKLEIKNIDLSFSKIKRNSNGEITRIKINIDDNKGGKFRTTYDDDSKGLPNVLIGITDEGKVVLSSSPKKE